MRIAIISDIHGNLTAFEAVLTDLRITSPDLILHGGDLADSGSAPAEIIDQICSFGWEGVFGNTDEMLFAPDSLTQFAAQSPAFRPLAPLISELAAAARAALGEQRIAWLRNLPRVLVQPPLALVHASPETAWRAPAPEATASEASDEQLHSLYAPLGQPIAVYGHIHRPFVRKVLDISVANTGSVSLSYDGDPRASYLLLDDLTPTIRRVAYDVENEIRRLSEASIPHASWIAKMLRAARPQMP
jgi:predicted phosphodiesterase